MSTMDDTYVNDDETQHILEHPGSKSARKTPLRKSYRKFCPCWSNMADNNEGENGGENGEQVSPYQAVQVEEPKKEPEEENLFFVYYLATFATIGGMLFGYDTGIVSGAMILIKDHYQLTTFWVEAIVSGTVGAAAVFSLIAGFTNDYFGRKATIMMASVVFTLGSMVMGAAQSKEMLLIGRIIVGIGIGFASMTVPIYVAEASPPAIRGRLVTLNQLFITIGILVSSIVAGAFSHMPETGWRYMLGLAAIPAIIQFFGFIYLPESPRHLVATGRIELAKTVLQKIRSKNNVDAELEEIKQTVEEDKKQEGSVLSRVLSTKHIRKALFIGCGLQVFQQLCGINTVIYYSATILRMAGFSAKDAIWLVIVPNTVNFLATFIGLGLVEKLGRKKLLIGSFIGVVLSLGILATGFQLMANFSPDLDNDLPEFFSNGSEVLNDKCLNAQYASCELCIQHEHCGFCFTGDGDEGTCLLAFDEKKNEGARHGRCKRDHEAEGVNWSHGYCPTNFTWMAVIGLAAFVMSFAPGLGPMPWTINAEIYPQWARSTCISLATGCNWVCNLIVSFFFLTLTETITKYGAFWLFGGVCFLGLLFTIVFVPETKNLTLEEVENLFKGTDNPAFEDDKDKKEATKF